ncbi:hypothetical protein GAYE_SCF35G5082 [Galdieria yellowstonensis]|uniref:ER membrane protein complex subunit 6 n=1 Tax=Galdieria yellowstonensis TaxID=3028027 RepID=A0AAV9II78_9RHOD|nr:hypothetical protein GAYE_SCF35G5082 [Galdieria yellowstonensis]
MSFPTSSNSIQEEYNNNLFYFYQNVFTVFGASVTGVLGITNLQGFLIYILLKLFLFLALYVKTKGDISCYFKQGIRSLFLQCLFSKDAFLSFILFWTLFYSITFLY